MKNQTARLLAYNALTVILADIVIYYAAGFRYALVAAAIGSAFVFFTVAYGLRVSKRLVHAAELDRTLAAMHTIYTDMKEYGKSIYWSIQDACRDMDGSAGASTAKLLGEIRKRLAAGQDLNEAISSANVSKDAAAHAALDRIAGEYNKGLDVGSSIKVAYGALWNTRRLEDARKRGSLQKYLTIGMALSAVLPSFALFAFIGYSMVYYSASLFFAFALFMLIIIPKLHELLRIHMAGLYA